jgi:class 3 adenylate cyclase
MLVWASVAQFAGPARAIRCAVDLVGALRALGIEIRAGLHTGEIELRGDDIGGISVHTAQRVCKPKPDRARFSFRVP